MPKSRKKEASGLGMLNKKLDTVLERISDLKKEETRIETEEDVLKREEDRILSKTSELEVAEQKALGRELTEIERLELLGKHIKRQVETHPLRKLTYRDIIRGSIGAFFGAAAHYTFLYGLEVAQKIDFARATILYGLTFIIGGVFLYLTGFRKIKDPKVLSFLPARLIVLYITAILTTMIVLGFFVQGFFNLGFESIYKAIATVSLTAMLGAATADLLGKD